LFLPKVTVVACFEELPRLLARLILPTVNNKGQADRIASRWAGFLILLREMVDITKAPGLLHPVRPATATLHQPVSLRNPLPELSEVLPHA
jgi:hypothetical protein